MRTAFMTAFMVAAEECLDVAIERLDEPDASA
jgi:hypothetical protein